MGKYSKGSSILRNLLQAAKSAKKSQSEFAKNVDEYINTLNVEAKTLAKEKDILEKKFDKLTDEKNAKFGQDDYYSNDDEYYDALEGLVEMDDKIKLVNKDIEKFQKAKEYDVEKLTHDRPKATTDLPTDEASRQARREEMGFDTEVLHGTSSENISDVLEKRIDDEANEILSSFDYDADPDGWFDKLETIKDQLRVKYLDQVDRGIFEFNPGKRHYNLGPHEGVYTSPSPDKAYSYMEGDGEQMYPLMVRGKKYFGFGRPFERDIVNSSKYNIPSYDESIETLSKATGESVEDLKKLKEWELVPLIKKSGAFEGFQSGREIKTFDPANLRSKFAQFDPTKAKSKDILAGGAGAALASSVVAPEKAEAGALNPVLKAAQKILSKITDPKQAAKLTGAEKEEYLNALDIVYGSRKKRMDDLGFDPGVQYHGTRADIEEFRPTKFGTFTTDDPKFASAFASGYRSGGSPQVYPLKVRSEKKFDPTNPEHLSDVLSDVDKEKFIKSYGSSPHPPSLEGDLSVDAIQKIIKNVEPDEFYNLGGRERVLKHLADPEYNWSAIENSELLRILKEKGYDSFDVTEQAKNLASLKPENIRSTSAAFDPRFKKSKNILSGGAATSLTDEDTRKSTAEKLIGMLEALGKPSAVAMKGINELQKGRIPTMEQASEAWDNPSQAPTGADIVEDSNIFDDDSVLGKTAAATAADVAIDPLSLVPAGALSKFGRFKNLLKKP